MNKNILLILCLIFSLTLVSATDGYGCPQEINFTEVINNSGNIEVVYETSCVSSDDVSVGISVFNDLGGSGSNCPKLNTTYQNNSYHITTACTYPEYNENLTYKVSLTCVGCSPSVSTLEINNTPVVEEEPEVIVTPTPTPTKKKSSGSSSNKAVKCGDWSVCTDGTQTQQCERNVVKSRACESVEIIQPVVEETTEDGVIDETAKWERTEPTITEEPEKPKSYAWIWWLVGILGIGVIILFLKGLKN